MEVLMKYRFLFTLLLVAMSLAGVAEPGEAPGPTVMALGAGGNAVYEVYPTGIYPDDRNNVQWALDNVDSPGIVIMKSTDASGNPLAFNFGGTTTGTGGVIKLLRPDITLTGDGWDAILDEPKTKIVGGGGPFTFSPTLSGNAMVFAVNAPGVTVRELKLTSTPAATGVYISSAKQQANDHPVVVERNHISVVSNAVLAYYSAGFPVRINNNVLRGVYSVCGRWIGFTLQPISAYPYDVAVVPTDSLGNAARYPFEIANNRMITTPGVFTQAMLIYGWSNLNSTDPDPEIGFRRYRQTPSSPYVNQFVQGDNGPVLISGNDIRMDSPPETGAEALCLGGTSNGLSHSVVRDNTMSGTCGLTIAVAFYGHDNILVNNDLSEMQAYTHVLISTADTTFSNNVLGKLIPDESELQPVIWLESIHGMPTTTPLPNPVENCVLMHNDYRLTERESGVIILVSNKEFGGAGSEVKNNLVFESGRFPAGTGGARNQILVIADMINPDTGLPYVHDNRIVGHPATYIQKPGIGQTVHQIMRLLMMMDEESVDK
jgi:hypothetical protein